MQARRDHGSGHFALYHRGVEIGTIRGGLVTFAGFTTRADASLAASLAHHALRRRRAREARLAPCGGPRSVATIREFDGVDGTRWGFELELGAEELQDVFATSRARTMWAALRVAGLDRRMLQLRAKASATA